MSFFKDLLTEDDGLTWCFARVASATGIMTYLGNAGYLLYKSGALDLVQFATGFTTLLAGAGAVIAAKQATTKSKP